MPAPANSSGIATPTAGTGTGETLSLKPVTRPWRVSAAGAGASRTPAHERAGVRHEVEAEGVAETFRRAESQDGQQQVALRGIVVKRLKQIVEIQPTIGDCRQSCVEHFGHGAGEADRNTERRADRGGRRRQKNSKFTAAQNATCVAKGIVKRDRGDIHGRTEVRRVVDLLIDEGGAAVARTKRDTIFRIGRTDHQRLRRRECGGEEHCRCCCLQHSLHTTHHFFYV